MKKSYSRSAAFLAFFFCTLFLSTTSFAINKAPNLDDPNLVKPIQPLLKHRATNTVILNVLKNHYEQREINNQLSSRLLDRYINDLDPSKSYFTLSDIQSFDQYRYKLDDAIKFYDLQPAFTIFNIFQERYVSRLVHNIKYLRTLDIKTIDFTKDETILIDRKDANWGRDEKALNELWRKRIKARLLQNKLDDKDLTESVTRLKKKYTNQLVRALQTNSEDAFQIYMNAFTGLYDPHTNYLSPKTSENFDINMKLSLEGIGAVLQTEEEYTKVLRLVSGGPASKAGNLQPNDRIVGVGQGEDGEILDIVGWRLDEVVQLIRGPKNSTVKLEIIPAKAKSDFDTKVIKIVRNKVKLEDRAAKGETIQIKRDSGTYNIGVIDIPTFYSDFAAARKGEKNYKSTTRDVENIINDLKAKDVDGIVIDLRNNGGGSLDEAIRLTGLFINGGPVVQVKDPSNISVYSDENPSVTYDGPLFIIVNRMSASASEIFAGALQDYQRAIVLGNRTFGKGTVQHLTSLNHGTLKITKAKFYRISGDSTQHEGVVPDISYPSVVDESEIGESSLPNALKWDTIPSASFNTYFNFSPILAELESNHASRSLSNPDFTFIRAQKELLEQERQKKTLSLNEAKRKKDQAAREKHLLDLENERRKAKGQPLLASLDDEEDTPEEEDEKKASEDGFLVETAEILTDYILLDKKALKTAQQ